MQFYKIQGELIINELSDENKKSRKEIARKLCTKTVEFNGSNNATYCFISEIDDTCVTFGMILAQLMKPLDFIEGYAAFVGINVEFSISEEITLVSMECLLNEAERNRYIDNDNEILDRFKLARMCGRIGRGINFDESLINCAAKKEELCASAEKLFATETLMPELERIYTKGNLPRVHGHPVHYVIETDNHDVQVDMYKIIFDALYANFRLNNCRYAFLDFDSEESYSDLDYEDLYKMSDGGAIVVRYDRKSDSKNETISHKGLANVGVVCNIAKRYRNSVLTVFCFPRNCEKAKVQFYENLGSMSFVELREDFLNVEAAKMFLCDLAKKNHIRTDKKLFSTISEGNTYLAADLQSSFENWYSDKLTSNLYPQYKGVALSSKESLNSAPQGSAYSELMEMIGLDSAKQVINKVINYCKMQKLYEKMGINWDNPVMHMVFSGNPGTAKTTVARLFARIMHENGILSSGHLLEVGRGDLVGKYVGWTAQRVQEKFKMASGGVLFIDEAYSLVDSSGSFGDEAINTIVQEMENHRADMVVIFAGYPDKMENFLQKNPGLRSRVAFHVNFEDYNSEELCQIANMISRKNGMRIDKNALSKLETAFEIAKSKSDFGNGRYVRNVFEQAKMNQASRLLKKNPGTISADEIATITAEDVIIPNAPKVQKRRIGFY